MKDFFVSYVNIFEPGEKEQAFKLYEQHRERIKSPFFKKTRDSALR